jgi:hypothetical protein
MIILLIMSKVKSEHYVPRFYLGKFTINRKGKSLWCFDKVLSKSFVCAIEDVACEKCFYDIAPGDSGVEKTLAKLESKIAAAYGKLISVDDIGKLNLSERKYIATFAIIQELRTREWREALKDLSFQVKERLTKHRLSEKLNRELQEVSKPDFHKEFQLKMLNDIPEYVEMLFGMKWILIENKTKMPFWASDHPVSRYNPIDKSPFGNLGLLCEGIQIFLPLTPRLALCFCDLAKYFTYPDRIVIDKLENAVFQNSLQVRWSTRSMFSCDNDFSLAEQILEEQPELRKINRKRFSVS